MSLKTFLKSIGDFFANIFKNLPKILQDSIGIGVAITNGVKNFDVNNPGVVDAITAIIPGNLDDKIVADLRVALPKIVIELRLVEATVTLTDPNEIMLAAVKVIQGLDGDVQSAFLHSFSIMAAQVAADGKLSWSDAVYLLQWYYKNKS